MLSCTQNHALKSGPVTANLPSQATSPFNAAAMFVSMHLPCREDSGFFCCTVSGLSGVFIGTSSRPSEADGLFREDPGLMRPETGRLRPETGRLRQDVGLLRPEAGLFLSLLVPEPGLMLLGTESKKHSRKKILRTTKDRDY